MENSNKRIRVPKYQGVYYLESEKRRHQGKPDRSFYITYKDIRGKKIWEKIGWTSEGINAQLASQIRGKRIQTVRHGDDLPQKKKTEPTLGDVWEKYDKWLVHGKKSSYSDRHRWKNHLKDRFADKLLSEISSLDMENLKIELLNEGLAPATVKHILVIVRQLFNKARYWKMYAGDNPINGVKLPELSNECERFLNYDEAHLLLDYLQKTNNWTHDIVLLSLKTGMRASEIFNLKWGYVYLENKYLAIIDSKNGDRRDAYITPSIENLFRKINPGQPGDFVFTNQKNEKINEISHAFANVIDKLGFNNNVTDRRQKVTFHTLRHTFASWLALENNSLLTIKKLLGHKTIKMTERYAHLLPDHKRAAVEQIESKYNNITNFCSSENRQSKLSEIQSNDQVLPQNIGSNDRT
jgi:integrase